MTGEDDLTLNILAKILASAGSPWPGENLIKIKAVDVELTDDEAEIVRLILTGLGDPE